MLLSLANYPQGQEPNTTLGAYYPKQNFVIAFLGYDSDLIDTSTILNSLPSKIYTPYTSYDVNYEIVFADHEYVNEFNAFIDALAVSDWTSDLNTTALEAQKANFKRTDIFTEKNGVSIDAREVEQYLVQHPISTSLQDENRYYIYVLNQSRLDYGNNDHWYNVTEIDPDSGRQRFYWRLEWDYPLNYDVKFPYAAFSEQEEIAFMDLTAFQWYLEWRAIWNTDTQDHPAYYEDLDHLLQGKTDSEKKDITTDTAKTWLYDWITQYFNFQPLGGIAPLGSSLSIQLKTYYNSSSINMGAEELQWIVNANYTRDVFKWVMQSQDISITVDFIDLENDSKMANYLEENKVDYETFIGGKPPFENWTYYDGFSLYDQIHSDPTYFDMEAADTVIGGFIFLLDNASFTSPYVPWAGRLFTGLGGGGRISILYEIDRAFMPDRVTRKAGLSKVLVHEIGHAIGFPHTFDTTFTSDFASEVMGYYPGASNFSVTYAKLFWRHHVDQAIQELRDLYQSKALEYQNGNSTLKDALLNVETLYTEFIIPAHQKKMYLFAYNLIKEAMASLTSGIPIDLDQIEFPTTTSPLQTTESPPQTTPPQTTESPSQTTQPQTSNGNAQTTQTTTKKAIINPFLFLASFVTLVLILNRKRRK